jgi:hypothetical protein
VAETLKIDNILKNIDGFRQGGKSIIRNRIYRVGVELEGGWLKLPDPGMELVPDGSIRGVTAVAAVEAPIVDQLRQPPAAPTPRPPIFRTRRDRDAWEAANAYQQQLNQQVGQYQAAAVIANAPRPIALHVGEYPSQVLELKEYQGWMKKYYPSHVNDTCGLHVHMSFKRALHYSMLMVPEYPQTIITYLAKWALEEKLPKEHPIWDRLMGKSSYCKLDFFPDDQAHNPRKVYDHGMKGHRYTVINYCHAKTGGTLECRLLPMMSTADLGIRAVKRVIDITNACLVALKNREPKESASLVIDGITDELHENSRIYV